MVEKKPEKSYSINLPNKSKRKNAFNRRKISVLRKCAELHFIANVNTACVFISENKEVNAFASEDFIRMMDEFLNFEGEIVFFTNKEEIEVNEETGGTIESLSGLLDRKVLKRKFE